MLLFIIESLHSRAWSSLVVMTLCAVVFVFLVFYQRNQQRWWRNDNVKCVSGFTRLCSHHQPLFVFIVNICFCSTRMGEVWTLGVSARTRAFHRIHHLFIRPLLRLPSSLNCLFISDTLNHPFTTFADNFNDWLILKRANYSKTVAFTYQTN